MRHKSLLLSTVLALGAAAWATSAAAQIETVVVTAQKRAQDIQKVPIAVTAISSKDLKEQGIRSSIDLQRIVPSLTMAPTLSTSTGLLIDIRGQAASDILLNVNQAVGLYQDGVNIPHPEGTSSSLFDLERVEVLRGPQGTLYGRNTTGGALNIITRGADFNGYHGFAGAEYGNHSDWKLDGAVNIPVIADKLALRLAYQHWNRDGFGSSAITGEKLGGDHNDNVGRISLLFTPRSDLTIDLRGEYDDSHIHGLLTTARGYVPTASSLLEAGLESGATLVPDSNSLCYPFTCASTFGALAVGSAAITAALAQNDLFHSTSATHQFENLRAWHLASNITWDVTNHVQIKSITGYHQFTDHHVADLDTMPFQLEEIGAGLGQLQPVVGNANFPAPAEEADRFISQELDFSGDLFDGGVTWLIGAFYSDDSGHGAQPVLLDPAAGSYTSTLFLFNGGAAPYSPQVIFNYDQKSVTDQSWAIFTQNDIKLRDDLTLTVGGRYTTDKLSQNISTWFYDASPYGVGGSTPPTAAAGSIPTFIDPLAGLYICPLAGTVGATSTTCDFHQNAKFTGYSYLVSLNWQMNENTLFYIKTSQGYRGGALQARAAGYAAARPETAHDYEFGMKGTFFDHRLQTNIDVYETLYTNKQQTQIVLINGVPSTPIINAATAKIKGFEAEVLTIPVDGLTLSGTLTYFDGKYKNFPTALNAAGATVDASGFAFPEPKWRYSLSARYDMPLWEGNLGLQADWAWRGKSPINALSADVAFPALQKEFADSVGLLNARIDYALPDLGGWKSGWTVSVFSTNVLDKHYQILGLDQSLAGGVATGVTQEPRMFGIQIRKTFGDE